MGFYKDIDAELKTVSNSQDEYLELVRLVDKHLKGELVYRSLPVKAQHALNWVEEYNRLRMEGSYV